MAHRYAERRDRVQRELTNRDLDGIVTYPGPNLQYFTGFRGEPVDRFHALYIPRVGDATLVTPAGYRTQAARNADVKSLQTVPGNDPVAVADALADLASDAETVAVDGNALHALTQPLIDALGHDTVINGAPVFRTLREQKSDSEIEALQRAANVADEVSREIRALGREAIGMTEAELATEIRSGLHARGAEGVSFGVVVGTGPNGADPALRYGERKVQAGEPVVLDFGCFIDGYASDQTRTVVFAGDPPAEFERVHTAVHEALDAGVAAVEPGVTAGDVDATARETLAEHGYADRFTHPTGHGVGLAAHEELAIASDTDVELEEGMVFSVEPGVYFEEEWGVRLEDLVVVTDEGCRRLNDSPRTWRAL